LTKWKSRPERFIAANEPPIAELRDPFRAALAAALAEGASPQTHDDRSEGHGARDMKSILLFAAITLATVSATAQTAIDITLPTAATFPVPASSSPLPMSDAIPRPPQPVTKNWRCNPEYPAIAARETAQGRTVLIVDVDAAGHATKTTIVQSAGTTRAHRVLDNAAAANFAQCAYDPARDDAGHPVAGSVELTFEWALHMDPKNPNSGYGKGTIVKLAPSARAPASQ
jgi:TonB family protein